MLDICLKLNIIQQHVHKHTSRVRDGSQTGCATEQTLKTKQCLDVSSGSKISLFFRCMVMEMLFIFN